MMPSGVGGVAIAVPFAQRYCCPMPIGSTLSVLAARGCVPSLRVRQLLLVWSSGLCVSQVGVRGRVGTATVGTPVTRRPPYRPGRAVCPHPVPRLHSLPCRVKTLFARARRQVGSSDSGPTCPGCVSFPGGVLPSSPSPCDRVSPSQSTMLDTTPHTHTASMPVASSAPPACHPDPHRCPGS